MAAPAIRVEQLSKMYRIGAREQQPKTTAGTVKQAVMSPIAYLRRTLRPPREEEIFWALRDISFEVQPGEVIGIIGRNGAGKSTLLKILSRITEPTSGRAVIKGRVGSLLEVGTGFHPELTGRENIYLNGTMLGMKGREIKKQFDEIVDFSGVEKFLDTPVKRYSSGMYVRLAFAVAAHLEPEILIIDEVLSVGDAEFQKKCLGKMQDVGKEGRTILFVSHYMAAVQQLCQKGIVLSMGKLFYSGTACEAVETYFNMSAKTLNYDKDGYVDLDTARDTVYQNKIFKKIRILDKTGSPCESFPMLSLADFEVQLQNTINLKHIDYGLGIFTQSGMRVVSYASWRCLERKPQGPCSMRLVIPSLRLAPGSYYVNLFAVDQLGGVWIDAIEKAIVFHVEPTDLYGTGKPFTSECGVIALEAEFQFT